MTLTELLGAGVGPVSVRTSEDGVIAEFDGHDVACVMEGATVRLRLEARLLWVGQARADELRARLAEHALARPELLTTDVADDGSTVTLTMWIDADPMTPVMFAQAVRSVRRSLAAAESQLTALGAAVVRPRPAGLPARAAASHEPTWSDSEPEPEPASVSSDAPADGWVPDQTAPEVEQQPEAWLEQQPEAWDESESQTGHEAAPESWDEPEASQQVEQADPEPASDEPRWGYVQQATEVRGLQDTDAIVGTLVPGQWYELRSTANGWTHVASVDGGMEGWAAAALLHERRG